MRFDYKNIVYIFVSGRDLQIKYCFYKHIMYLCIYSSYLQYT
nr:MAG TPA: hypothetical protein [Caudoviricetes sp.]